MNNNICKGNFNGSEVESGIFCGGEIEPGTFHGGEIEPGTFHNGIDIRYPEVNDSTERVE